MPLRLSARLKPQWVDNAKRFSSGSLRPPQGPNRPAVPSGLKGNRRRAMASCFHWDSPKSEDTNPGSEIFRARLSQSLHFQSSLSLEYLALLSGQSTGQRHYSPALCRLKLTIYYFFLLACTLPFVINRTFTEILTVTGKEVLDC